MQHFLFYDRSVRPIEDVPTENVPIQRSRVFLDGQNPYSASLCYASIVLASFLMHNSTEMFVQIVYQYNMCLPARPSREHCLFCGDVQSVATLRLFFKFLASR